MNSIHKTGNIIQIQSHSLLQLELENAFDDINEHDIHDFLEKSNNNLEDTLKMLENKITLIESSNNIASKHSFDRLQSISIQPISIPRKNKFTIDFHGLRRRAARQITLRIKKDISPNFSADYSFIYGRGKNSKSGPVIKNLGLDTLKSSNLNIDPKGDEGRVVIKNIVKDDYGNLFVTKEKK